MAEFSRVLEKTMQQVANDPSSLDKISGITQQVDDTKKILIDNIGEAARAFVFLLSEQTSCLAKAQSLKCCSMLPLKCQSQRIRSRVCAARVHAEFSGRSSSMKRRYWYKNLKLQIAIAALLVVSTALDRDVMLRKRFCCGSSCRLFVASTSRSAARSERAEPQTHTE
jgi:hypothetical protein